MSALALALLFEIAISPRDAGLAATRDGRYEEASQLLRLAVNAAPNDYDALVALGVAEGRRGDVAVARQALDRAIALQPRRSEGYVERGGLSFVEKDYSAAIKDLRTALRYGDDPHARDLLASSLQLSGRGEEAIEEWNRIDQPRLRSVKIEGLRHTREKIARHELTVREGDLLDAGQMRESRRRLEEVGVFSRIELRPVPLGDGKADLEVDLTDRAGFFTSLPEFVATTGAYAATRKVRLRYSNLFGEGVSIGAQYRWEKARPKVAVTMDWPRPLGLPAIMHVEAEHERQPYTFMNNFSQPELRETVRGVGLSFRRVLGAETIASIGIRARDRTFVGPARSDAPDGLIVGVEGELERRLIDTRRHLLKVDLYYFQAGEALGSDFEYPQGVASLGYEATLGRRDDRPIPLALFATRVLFGLGGTGMPVDEMFMPGAASEMQYPLRAHKLRQAGVLGKNPIGRELWLANAEWRQRIINAQSFQLALVPFYDVARTSDTVDHRTRTIQDVGAGLRLAVGRSAVLRLDYGYSPTDRKTALTAGFGQAF